MVLEVIIGVVVGGVVEDRAVKVFAGPVKGLAAKDSADVDGATEDGAIEGFVAEDSTVTVVKGFTDSVTVDGAVEGRATEGTAVKGAFEVDGAGIVCRGFTC